MKGIIKYIFCILWVIGFYHESNASNTYSECILSYQFGDTSNYQVIVTPVDDGCQTMCKRECGSFSRQDSLGIELNTDIIIDCMTNCQSGRPYKSYFRELVNIPGSTNTRVAYSNFAETKVNCSAYYQNGIPTYFAKKADFLVQPGDKIIVQLLPSQLANKIYMCGYKNVRLTPVISSITPADWQDNNHLTSLQYSDQHECFKQSFQAVKQATTGSTGTTPPTYTQTNPEVFTWAGMTNYNLWASTPPTGVDYSNKCYWNAKNSTFTDTGIYIKDGDELSISYNGDFIWSYDSVANTGRKGIFDLVTAPGSASGDVTNALKNWVDNSTLLFLEPGGDMATGSGRILQGEGARLIDQGQNAVTQVGVANSTTTSGAATNPVQWGLTGTVFDLNVSRINSTAANCQTPLQIATTPSCSTVTGPGTAAYSFSGLLTAFNATPEKLALKTYSPDTTKSLGGYEVIIDWGGCPLANGQNLQYTIHDPASTTAITESDWLDVTQAMLNQDLANGGYIDVKTAGTIYLRIKPLVSPVTNDPTIDDLYTNPGNRFGQYFVSLSKPAGNTWSFTGPIQDVVSITRTLLFGDVYKNGVSQTVQGGITMVLYSTVVANPFFVNAIRGVLVLYVVMVGLGFLMGTVKSTTQELVTRIFKFAVVAVVISPGSWQMFLQYFYSLFINGGMELIATIVGGGFTPDVPLNISDDPAKVFAVFDKPLKEMTGSATWNKIFAIIFTGPLGCLIAIILIACIVCYIIAVAQITVMFLVSMLIIALLILIGPIFMCFMLFKATAQFFDSWWKFLLSFTLQPVIAFTAITIINFLIMIAFKTALGFSVCPGCFLRFYYPHDSNLASYLIDFCLIKGYEPLVNAHFPGVVTNGLSMQVVAGAITFYILAKAMLDLGGFIVSLTNIIITGNYINVTNLSPYAQNASAMAQVAGAKTLGGLKSGGGKIYNYLSNRK